MVGSGKAEVLEPRVLAGDPPPAAFLHDLDDQAQCLGEAVADDDAVRIGAGAPDAVQVVRQRVPQLLRAANVQIAHAVAGRLVQDAPQRLQPDLSRELGDVWPAVREVDPRRRQRVSRHALRWSGPGRGAGDDVGGDPRRAARTAGEVALGDELLVGLHDDAAGEIELVGEGSRRRQRRVGQQPAGSDRDTELALELAMEGRRFVSMELDQQLPG